MVEKYTKDELSEWFKTKATNAIGSTARNTIMSSEKRRRDNNVVGGLFFFKYDPKGKNYLPMYDRYPLALVFQKNSDSFLAFNLHYLSVSQRSTMLGIIYKYDMDYGLHNRVTSKSGSSNWDNLMHQLDGTGLEGIPSQCIKRYLYSHVRSKFIEIYPDEYSKAIQLPIESWVLKR